MQYLFWANLVPKLQKTLFEMILGVKGYSRVLIQNLATVFVNSVPKIPVGANLAPKLQIALFKMKYSTAEHKRGLISNSTILILYSVPKAPFLGKFGP